jgi:hypothetical protein
MEFIMNMENEQKITRSELIELVNLSIDSINKIKDLNNALIFIGNLDPNDAHHIGAGHIYDVLESERADLLYKASESLSDEVRRKLEKELEDEIFF